MNPTALDERTRRYANPTRVVWQDRVRDVERLLEPARGQASGGARPGAMLPFGASLIIDFGKELHGGVQIITGWVGKGPRKRKVRLRFGESIAEVLGEPNNDHSIHDTELELPLMGWSEYGCTGFRFVRLDMLTVDAEIEIKELRAVSLMREVEWKGSFECSDPRLNEIWKTGAYTTQLCLQDYIWDGIKRDRLVWMGDMHPEIMTVLAAFGRLDVVERSLDLVRDEAPPPKHMNGIGSYSLWWIVAQRDWFLHNGGRPYLEAQKDYIVQLLNLMFDTMVGPDWIECMPGRRFLDWPSEDDVPSKHVGLQALISIAFGAGAELCRVLGMDGLAARCADASEKTRVAPMPPTASKQVNALRALAGCEDAAKINAERLAVDPFRGVSTFYGYYVLQARAKAGDIQGCLDLISKYWGAMLDLGATTFWEHFELDWAKDAFRIDEMPVEGKRDVHGEYGAFCFKGLRHSLCHGWASGPTPWLSEHVLGVKILEPGSRRVAVRPALGSLDWARGRFPTPLGPIEVEHRRSETGEIESSISAPDGVEVEGR